MKNRKNYSLRANTAAWPRSFLTLGCLMLMVIVLLINVVCALAPEIHYDALVYQIALPGFYKMHGRIIDVPFNFNSYFPQNMNMLYLLTLLVSNGNVAKLLHLFLGLGSLLAIYVFSRKHFSRNASITATAGFYLVPQVAIQSWSALNELGITFYALLNIVCLDNWLGDKDHSGQYLYLAAIFSGFALGMKYMSVIITVISLCLIFYHYGYLERRWKKAFYEIGKFTVIVLVMISPWLVRNFNLTGSPAAPFAAPAGKNAPGYDFRKDVFLKDCAHPQSFSVQELLITPWLNTLGKSTLDNLAGPLFTFFVPLFIMLLIRAKMDRKLKLLFFYFLVYYIMWRSQTSVWRYFLPAMAVFCVIAGYLLYDEKISSFNRGLLKIMFGMILVGNLAVICMAFEGIDPAPVVAGIETKGSYLGRSHLFYQAPLYPAIEYINKNIPLDSRILFVGDSRGYYCERDYIANTAFDVPTFQKYFQAAKNAAELAQYLRRDKLTHLLVNETELTRLQKQYEIFDSQPRDMKLLRDFWLRYVRVLFNDQGVVLYEIL
ncbi:MAG: glycosyltransferase family 39 protein [bacterium]|nr:glycosyltransferase family 39 protein [bacterium]